VFPILESTELGLYCSDGKYLQKVPKWQRTEIKLPLLCNLIIFTRLEYRKLFEVERCIRKKLKLEVYGILAHKQVGN